MNYYDCEYLGQEPMTKEEALAILKGAVSVTKNPDAKLQPRPEGEVIHQVMPAQAYVPEIRAPLDYSTVYADDVRTAKLGVSQRNNILMNRWPKPFDMPGAREQFMALRRENPAVGQVNTLEDVWISVDTGEETSLTTNYRWDTWVRRVKTYRKEDYWTSLNVCVDPWEYIRLLAAWKPAGICLFEKSPRGSRVPFPYSDSTAHWLPQCEKRGLVGTFDSPGWLISLESNWRIKNEPRKIVKEEVPAEMFALPQAEADRFIYTNYVKRWREVILLDTLENIDHLLAISTQEDLPSLELMRDAYVNRRSSLVQGNILHISTGHPFVIQHERPKYSGVQEKLVSYIPHREQDAPIVSSSVGTETCQDALRRIYNETLALMNANLIKLGGRIAQLKDKSKKLIPNLDPRTNFFLVPDLKATAATGKPVYANVAANLTAGWQTGGRTTLPENIASQLPSAEMLLKAPGVLQEGIRYRTDEGGAFSYSDLLNMNAIPPDKKPSLIPWLIGGAAGIAAIAAFTA